MARTACNPGWPTLLALMVHAWTIIGAGGRRIKVQHLSPFLGRHNGGLLVNVTGKGFLVSTNPKCRFGAMEVVATVRSPTLVQCYTPVNTDFKPETPYNAQDKMLEVSLNGVDWTVSKRMFTFYDHARVQVSLFEPEGGPTAGGTPILVHGSSFRSSEHLKCTWDGDNDPALKVEATFIDYYTLQCVSPPITGAGARSLEIALDDYHFTGHARQWTYYDPATLIVSAVDPIGGPVRGGTLIEILGQGFAKLGGAVQHGSGAWGANFSQPYRRIDAGPFCKFSFDAVRAPRGQDPWCAETSSMANSHYDGLLDSSAFPHEGAAALTRAASSRQLRNYSCFTASSTPQLGKLTSIVQATFVDSGRMLCESPRFSGVLRDNRALLRVHVTLNGDFHDIAAISNSNATYIMYDPREARIQALERTGGPLSGNTFIIIYGKLFFDFTLRSLPGRSHLLQCRFGFAGMTPATWYDAQRVACHSPQIHGVGHRQSIGVDITYNGQDFLEGPNPAFTFSPLDAYSQEGQCRDAFGASTAGTCLNNFTGIAVSEVQPFGGPSNGNTIVVIIGRLFAVQGPSILCKFGNLSMVNATFLNDTALQCLSPPNPSVLGSFEDHPLEITLNGEPNFLTASSVPFVYYDHNATLAVSAIYPRAGPKTGGNTITVYGAGFRVLGGKLKSTCAGVNLTEPTSEELYGEYRTEGSLSRATTKALGDSRVCSTPLLEGTNRGLQCLFGDLPPVHGYLLRLEGSNPTSAPDGEPEDDRVGTALICELPPLPPDRPSGQSWPAPYVPGDNERGLLPGSPYSVCVEITLNGNRTQATDGCVEFTYYDT
jgi:hypothetical protein